MYAAHHKGSLERPSLVPLPQHPCLVIEQVPPDRAHTSRPSVWSVRPPTSELR